MEQLLQYIHALSPFSDESWHILQPALTKRTYKKGQFLLEEGQMCQSLFYINSGYCKSYYTIDGTDKNTAFFFGNDLVTNISSFGSGQRSSYSIRACEPMTVVVFDKQELLKASAQSPEIETLGRNCIRLFASRQEEFANLSKLYTPKQSLDYLEKHHPEMMRKVPLTQLSSFLGVARETLSRIRKQRVQH